MGSIRKVKNGYKGRVRRPEGGEDTKTYRTKAQAANWVSQREAEKASGLYTDPRRARMRVDEWIDLWWLTKRGLRPSSQARAESVVRVHIRPNFGRISLGSVSNQKVRAWVAEMLDDGVAPATVKKNLNVLNQLFKAAISDRRLVFNPCDDVPLPSSDENEQRFLDRHEVDALVDVMTARQPRFRALVLLAAYGGLRWGELGGLKVSDVDLFRAQVRVRQVLSEVNGRLSIGPPKTKNSFRSVPIPRSVAVELGRHIEEFAAPGDDALCFVGPRGGLLRRAGFRRSLWRPSVQRAGLAGLRFHDLRHTFVSLLIDSGCNVKKVSKWAGHSSVAFTLDRYGHLYEDRDEDLAEKLDALLELRGGSLAIVGDKEI